jgi:hypothetical protein
MYHPHVSGARLRIKITRPILPLKVNLSFTTTFKPGVN